MQADEIIQQKEWHELNAGEKEIVKELADTESEYNLLKKMLQVSGGEAGQAPVISSRIKEELLAVMAVKKISYKRYLYAAAAVIIAIIVSTVFIKKENDDGAKIVKIDTVEKNSGQDLVHISIEPKDTGMIAPIKKDTAQQIVVHFNKPKQKAHYDLRSNDINNDEPVYAAVNKTVSEEKELLNLVTEMY